MGDNNKDNIQLKGELAVISLNLIGDTLSALGGTIELQEARDTDFTQKLEVIGDWLVVLGDIIEFWLLLREQTDSNDSSDADI